jgi:acetate---CoA ligase (ADP-forming)
MSSASYTLEAVLRPRSVAISGASRAPHKWGHVAAKQLIAGGFPGNIYLIYMVKAIDLPEISVHSRQVDR